MKLLVAGGAGFIGSNFIRYILSVEAKCSIVNFDKLTYAGNADNLKSIRSDPRYEFIRADICNFAAVKKALKGCDALVNFAAQTHVDRSIMDASSFVKTNVLGAQVLLEASRQLKIRRFIQISTDEVYGSLERGSFREESPLKPNSPYAASKAAADLLCRSYFKTYNLPVVITRSSNNFGPYQYPEKFVSLAITNAIDNVDIPIYGDGKNVRDWIYVEDNCRAIHLILKKGVCGEIYNIAAGYEMPNNKMVDSILGFMGGTASKKRYVKDRLGHDRRYSLCSQKIGKLGFKPKYNFQDALATTVNWYRDNLKWWRKIKFNDSGFKRYYRAQYGVKG